MIKIGTESGTSEPLDRTEFQMRINIVEVIKKEEKKKALAIAKDNNEALRLINIKLFALRDRLTNSIF